MQTRDIGASSEIECPQGTRQRQFDKSDRGDQECGTRRDGPVNESLAPPRLRGDPGQHPRLQGGRCPARRLRARQPIDEALQVASLVVAYLTASTAQPAARVASQHFAASFSLRSAARISSRRRALAILQPCAWVSHSPPALLNSFAMADRPRAMSVFTLGSDTRSCSAIAS